MGGAVAKQPSLRVLQLLSPQDLLSAAIVMATAIGSTITPEAAARRSVKAVARGVGELLSEAVLHHFWDCLCLPGEDKRAALLRCLKARSAAFPNAKLNVPSESVDAVRVCVARLAAFQREKREVDAVHTLLFPRWHLAQRHPRPWRLPKFRGSSPYSALFLPKGIFAAAALFGSRSAVLALVSMVGRTLNQQEMWAIVLDRLETRYPIECAALSRNLSVVELFLGYELACPEAWRPGAKHDRHPQMDRMSSAMRVAIMQKHMAIMQVLLSHEITLGICFWNCPANRQHNLLQSACLAGNQEAALKLFYHPTPSTSPRLSSVIYRPIIPSDGCSSPAVTAATPRWCASSLPPWEPANWRRWIGML
jgi:hypothetical protein